MLRRLGAPPSRAKGTLGSLLFVSRPRRGLGSASPVLGETLLMQGIHGESLAQRQGSTRVEFGLNDSLRLKTEVAGLEPKAPASPKFEPRVFSLIMNSFLTNLPTLLQRQPAPPPQTPTPQLEKPLPPVSTAHHKLPPEEVSKHAMGDSRLEVYPLAPPAHPFCAPPSPGTLFLFGVSWDPHILRQHTFKKKAPKAIKEIRKFAQKSMGTADVRIDVKVNKQIWSRGIRSVPRRVRVRIASKRNEEEDAKEEFYSLVTVAEVPPEGLRGLGTKVIDEAD
ncbi:60S ribosomal protein L31 [Apostasia shenzhenica]|uniref:60S ribosomal protein L31 n=1 Tax=Apostasia shenzhenica TaxID=1088818 RepID=A0A2I0A7U1_9ASPA|nr:60S ribosomal protein L31 [Apostasia shenzhenica]